MSPDSCPNCGADVPRNAKTCPECGSDEKTGWSDNAYAGRLGLPRQIHSGFHIGAAPHGLRHAAPVPQPRGMNHDLYLRQRKAWLGEVAGDAGVDAGRQRGWRPKPAERLQPRVRDELSRRSPQQRQSAGLEGQA